MATADRKRPNRSYRKASEYLATKQGGLSGSKTLDALEEENAELREKLTASIHRLEGLEAEFAQSREYFSTQLDITNDKLNRTTQALKGTQESYFELQSINYDLEQKLMKVASLENERLQLSAEVDELVSNLTTERRSLQKMQKENERLRKDCNLAVSLLECNAGNFKQQRTNELPRDLRDRVEEYQVDLSQYNEYINPYVDDSDEEEPAAPKQLDQLRQVSGTVPAGLLANVLKKPENILLNLQQTDYIRDPNLNSVYKGQIAEKKLIKHDYPSSPQYFGKPMTTLLQSEKGGTMAKDPIDHGGQSSKPSPWERKSNVTPSANSSPWEMSANPQSTEFEIDDHGSASAYGAYPVSYRSSRPRGKCNVAQPRQLECKSGRMKKLHSELRVPAVRSPSSGKPQKGTGENQDVYVSKNFQQQHGGANEQIIAGASGSGPNSQKSTPGKVATEREKGTLAERSSLLDQDQEDDDEMVMTIELRESGLSAVGIVTPSRQCENTLGIDDFDPELDDRDLDYEDHDGESKKSKNEVAVGRSLNNGVKENSQPVPDIDLLHLNEDTLALGVSDNSAYHQIMMQQTCGSDGTMMEPSAILPHLPPPSGLSYDGELILCENVPPPPDMFGELTTTTTNAHFCEPNLPDPMAISQSNIAKNVVELANETSPSPSTNPLEDLKVFIKKEFEAAKSPQKLILPAVQKVTKTPSTEEPELLGTQALDETISRAGEQNMLYQIKVSTASSPLDHECSAVRDMTAVTSASSQSKQKREIECPQISPVEKEISSLNFVEKDDTIKNKQPNSLTTSSEPCIVEQNDGKAVTTATSGDDTISGQSLDVSEMPKNVLGRHSKSIEEPLEVLEPRKEPLLTGGGKRRRNSFEKAREFGNVLKD